MTRAEWQKAWRVKRIGEGWCSGCVSEMPRPGLRTCETCAVRSYIKSQKRLEKERQEPSISRNRHLKAYYGLGLDGFRVRLDAQGGVCAVCGGDGSSHKKGLVVDHCHKTKEVRGILCAQCNVGLGYFRDDPELLNKAIEYLLGRKRG